MFADRLELPLTMEYRPARLKNSFVRQSTDRKRAEMKNILGLQT